MVDTLLKVENVKTQFVTWNGLVRAADGVNFEIRYGETLGLVGETGCGKSVTALSIMNLIPENVGAIVDGKILFEGKDITEYAKKSVKILTTKRGKLKLKVKRRWVKKNVRFMNKVRGNLITMIFQEPMTTLNPTLSIKQQIQDILFSHHIPRLASRIIARRTITQQQLADLALHLIDKKENDYLQKFIQEHPELQAIEDQVSFIVGRHDISDYNKKQNIYKLYDKNRKIPIELKRLAARKTHHKPKFVPRIIKEEAKRLGIEVLTQTNIPEAEKVIEQYPHELSGGMRQRVVIAIALVRKPKLLIADEPTTALDVTIQAQILDIMKDLKKKLNTSILFITHDLGVIADISDRIAVMYAGNIIEISEKIDFFTAPKHPYSQGLLKAIPSYGKEKGRLNIIPGSVPNLITPPRGCKFHPRCKFAFEKCGWSADELVEVVPQIYDSTHNAELSNFSKIAEIKVVDENTLHVMFEQPITEEQLHVLNNVIEKEKKRGVMRAVFGIKTLEFDNNILIIHMFENVERPQLTKIGPEHYIACWLYTEQAQQEVNIRNGAMESN